MPPATPRSTSALRPDPNRYFARRPWRPATVLARWYAFTRDAAGTLNPTPAGILRCHWRRRTARSKAIRSAVSVSSPSIFGRIFGRHRIARRATPLENTAFDSAWRPSSQTFPHDTTPNRQREPARSPPILHPMATRAIVRRARLARAAKSPYPRSTAAPTSPTSSGSGAGLFRARRRQLHPG